MLCSNCGTEISQNYCPECGQQYVGKRISFSGLLHDFFDSFFSMDGSLPRNIKAMIFNSQMVVKNYWDGYRKYFFSPFRLVIISTIVLGINFLITEKRFLEVNISTTTPYVTLPVVLYMLFLPIFTITTKILYFRQKKNLIEHLVLNAYSMGIWTFVFGIISIFLFYINLDLSYMPFFFLYLLLIIIWDSLAFNIGKIRRVLFIILHFFLFASVFVGLFFLGDYNNP